MRMSDAQYQQTLERHRDRGDYYQLEQLVRAAIAAANRSCDQLEYWRTQCKAAIQQRDEFRERCRQLEASNAELADGFKTALELVKELQQELGMPRC